MTMLKIYFDAGDIGTEFFAEKLEQGFFAGTTIGLVEPGERIRVAGLHSWVRPATSTASVRSVGHIVVPDKLQKAVRTLSIASVYKG